MFNKFQVDVWLLTDCLTTYLFSCHKKATAAFRWNKSAPALELAMFQTLRLTISFILYEYAVCLMPPSKDVETCH